MKAPIATFLCAVILIISIPLVTQVQDEEVVRSPDEILAEIYGFPSDNMIKFSVQAPGAARGFRHA
jgi:hypothetical protein